MLRGIQGLVAAGCGAIVVPCNTAHGWYENMVAGAGVPVLHIVDAAAHALAKVAASGSKVAVVGTGRTLRMRLYQDRLEPRGWTVLVPDASEMERLVSPAIAMVKANRVTEAYAPLAEMVEILAGRGAAAVVLGCTEIPLAMQAGPSSRLPVPLVDTIDALAIAAIAWSRAGNWTSVT